MVCFSLPPDVHIMTGRLPPSIGFAIKANRFGASSERHPRSRHKSPGALCATARLRNFRTAVYSRSQSPTADSLRAEGQPSIRSEPKPSRRFAPSRKPAVIRTEPKASRRFAPSRKPADVRNRRLRRFLPSPRGSWQTRSRSAKETEHAQKYSARPSASCPASWVSRVRASVRPN
jgi:hypothetical protein